MAKQSNTKETIDSSNPKSVPVPNTSGYPQKDIKTTGIKIRGTGAATKGTATLGYVATTVPNIVALVVSGTAATAINWAAKIEMITT
jgi:hypothetical protein